MAPGSIFGQSVSEIDASYILDDIVFTPPKNYKPVMVDYVDDPLSMPCPRCQQLFTTEGEY